MRRAPPLLAIAVLLLSGSAQAGTLRELCPDRPGKATPACTLDPGHVEYETSIMDWTHDRAGGIREDSVLVADSLLRIGLNMDTEAQIVLAYAVFIRRPGSPSRRNAFAEWFVIDTNKIRHVYSAMYYPPNDLPVPNWAPYDGNFPLPAELAPPPAVAVPAKQ